MLNAGERARRYYRERLLVLRRTYTTRIPQVGRCVSETTISKRIDRPKDMRSKQLAITEQEVAVVVDRYYKASSSSQSVTAEEEKEKKKQNKKRSYSSQS